MQAVTLAEVADELYGLPPAKFTAARDERARAARAAGRAADAAAIRKLTRPTMSAWLVNQLSRDAPEQLGRLFDVGEALQDAQRTLAGDRLRELSAQRRHVVSDLLPVAAGLAGQAGQPASATVLDEVRATLEAALADQGARDAVRSGRLTKALAYAGLGEVDLTAAVAAPGARPATPGPPAGSAEARRGPQSRRAAPAEDQIARPTRAERAADALATAEAAADSAASAVAAADDELSAIGEQRQFLRRRITHLERELAQVRDEDARLGADAQQARQRHDEAEREHAAARRRLDQARRQVQRESRRG